MAVKECLFKGPIFFTFYSMGPLKQDVRRKLAFKTKTSAGCIFALQEKRGLKHSPVISAVAPPPPGGLKFIHSSELSGRRHSDELVTACHSNTHCSKVACVHEE